MHRRHQPRVQAHIAAPRDPPSRAPRSRRLWLVLVLLFVLALAHYALHAPSPAPPTPRLSPPVLLPKNYLNASDPSPFPFCPSYGPDDALAALYGTHALSKIVMHAGSGQRVRRLITKALAAQPVTISIIGGSVSACHGAGDDPVAPGCYPARFFDWWNSVFPHPATELTNGAMRRTNSGYFGYCSAHHIPDATDLVIIELDGDDTTDPDMLENFETLVRSLLIRADAPAVVLLGHFNPQTHTIYGFAGPDHAHDIVAQFYDVPHISTKPIHYPAYIHSSASLARYFVDPVLASPAGHKVLADVLVAYFQSQICTAWAVATGAEYPASPAPPHAPPADAHALFGGVGQRKGVPEPEVDPDAPRAARRPARPAPAAATSPPPVPPGRISSRPGDRPFEEIAPYCVSANDLINPLPPSMFYGSGWSAYHAPAASEGAGRPGAHYWYSALPMSKLRVPIQVGAGDVGVYYVREPRRAGGSKVECWVDDNVAGKRGIDNSAPGEGGEEELVLVVIDHGVSRGSHFVECVLVGEEGEGVPPFKIVGIFAT
ncbi:hypothetical protein C0992_000452 [Termitomyces sp. T32_za158]|nr:hypothetical protein C0992_000452 [Termitomyces sp. T32_za158]